MLSRYALALIATAVATTASAQESAGATVVRLRNISADAAARALTEHAARATLPIVVAADPRSNSVFVAGTPGARRQAVAVLAELDRAPKTIRVELVVLDVPAGYPADIGMGDNDQWLLTPREVGLFNAVIGREKDRSSVSVLSRPQLVVADNQPGFVQVGSEADGLSAGVTPRLAADGASVRLHLRTTIWAGGERVAGAGTTVNLVDGASVMVRFRSCKTPADRSREMLLIATVHTMG